jgi:hypothetical protein
MSDWGKIRDIGKSAIAYTGGGPIGGLMAGGGGSSSVAGLADSGGIETLLGGGILGDLTGANAADASISAANIAAASQREQLEYLKEINRLPQQYKEEALTKLAGLQTGEGQQAMIEQAEQSPYYKAIMGGRQAGEDAILRNAAATGRLRSGNTQAAFYDYNTQLKNKALAESYGQQVSGLQGLAGIGTNESDIGQIMSDIGMTQAQGITAGAQAQQQGAQNIMNTLLGIGGMIL